MSGLKFNGKIEQPQETNLSACELDTGELFVLEEELGAHIEPFKIRCAVCHYEDGDNDVRYVTPFANVKDQLDAYDELPYVSYSAKVRRIEITASGIRVI